MIRENIDKMIMAAMKGTPAAEVLGKEVVLSDSTNLINALKQIKAKLVTAEKSGKAYDETEVLETLKKQHEDSIAVYKSAGRDTLATNEADELAVIKAFLPEEVGVETITAAIDEMVSKIREDHEPSMRDMGKIMNELKSRYPSVNGKLVSEVFKKAIS